MKIHEYQAKELLAAAGATVPKHIVVTTAEGAEKAFEDLGGSGAMIKAQIHAGGRGAGQLAGYPDKLGGVKFVNSKEKAKAVAQAMLSHYLVTKQTGPEGQKVNTLIVRGRRQSDGQLGVSFDDPECRPFEASFLEVFDRTFEIEDFRVIRTLAFFELLHS